MKRLIALPLLLLCLAIVRADDAKNQPAGDARAFWVEEVEGIRVAHCVGEADAWGKAYGEAFKDEIQGLYKGYVLASAGDQMQLAMQAVHIMETHVPDEYKAMLKSLSEGCGLTYDEALSAQCYADLLQMLMCSTFVALGDASADGKPIFGRNMDYPTRGVLHEHTIVTVFHRGEGKSFLTIGFPGMMGAVSGMNDRGLSIAVMNVFSPDMTPDGMPYLLMFRSVLETCATVDEAAELIKKTPRTTPNNLMACDAEGAAVIEFSPKAVEVRRPAEGRIWSTNHFESDAMSNKTDPNEPTTCRRYGFLAEELPKAKVDAEAAKKLLAGVADEEMTIQSMIFRPASLELWLACGKVPSTSGEFKRLDASALFGAGAN